MNISIEQIAKCIRCPEASVAENWPRILTCMTSLGIADDLTQIAMLATVAVESAWTFKPIKEYGGQKYLESKPYYPYYGRGFIQMTWRSEYEHWGQQLGIDLVGNPDKALDPDVSASHAAGYFVGRAINHAAQARDWKKVRRAVNGGLGSYSEFLTCVTNLLAATGLA